MKSNLDINTAEHLGFCAGVKQAIRKADEACEKYGNVQMLGDIVHNEIVVQDLEKQGVKVIENIGEVDPEIPILFRAHGTSPQIWKKAQQMGLTIIDATCPLVKEIHDYAEILENENRTVFIIGDRGHDEVNGIASRLEDPIIISEINSIPDQKIEKAGVVIQSTQNLDFVNKIIINLTSRVEDLRIINTICAPTRERQKEVLKIARNNDLVIIIGSFTSANTKRLVKVAKKINKNTRQVERAEDLKEEWFINISSVGISAGASTPEQIIDKVRRKIASF